MSINWQEILFHFLGGLGLFLYSIKTMGDGLQQAAGDRLRFYIDKYTSNPFWCSSRDCRDCPDSIKYRGYSYHSWTGQR